MTAIALPSAYSAELEDALFEKVRANAAPHLPAARLAPPRGPVTPQETWEMGEYAVWCAVHDFFIAQVTARGIARLFKDDTEMQFVLARQLRDDADHAEVLLARVEVLSGHDQIDRVARRVEHQWTLIGELIFENWLSFIAWEFHYEHHILARLYVNKRTALRADLPLREYAEQRINADEEIHRIRLTQWWLRKLQAAAPVQREAWIDELIAADERLQRRMGGYLREAWAINHRALGTDLTGHAALYDTWRREMLSLLTGRSAGTLALTGLVDDDAPRFIADPELTEPGALDAPNTALAAPSDLSFDLKAIHA